MKKLFIHGVFSLLALCSGWAVDNPLSFALDGSVVRHNGRYFSMAGATKGVMLTSENLMDWQLAGSVLEPSVAGPYELLQYNGLFYLYAQKRGVVVAPDPIGPFSRAGERTLQGEEIRLFQDPAGALLAFSQRSGGLDGGQLWMQVLSAPWMPRAEAQQQLFARRGMWDSLDQAGLGVPDVLAYRGNYYLLYAANHPGPRTGLREIGVAMAKEPEELGNPGKRADPLLTRNAERLARTYQPLLPTGEYTGWSARYTLDAPATGWYRPGFTATGWRTGKGGFGSPDKELGAQIHACRTDWDTGNLWVRRSFRLSGEMPQTPVLHLRHEGAVQVFLNGEKVFESTNAMPAYANVDLSQVTAELFRQGENVLAVHAVANRANEFRFLDYGLSDAGEHPVEPTVYGLDAPRVIEGPNGFEKWLSYRAWWNGVPGSGLDRVFFFGEDMVVDGPTTAATSGYHPPPSRPTFFDGFDSGADGWQCTDGEWAVTNGILRLQRKGKIRRAMLLQKPAANYLFETYIRLPKQGQGSAGVVAFDDGKRELRISIHPMHRRWEYRIIPGSSIPKTFNLPPAFRWEQRPPGFTGDTDPMHRLRIVKNGGYFDVMLDDFKLTARKPIVTDMTNAGVPGLFGSQTGIEFDSVTYTVGWDEHDARITGWGSAARGARSGGTWQHRKAYGLEQTRVTGVGRAFKGDLLDQYEFTVNTRVDTLAGPGKSYGIFPVYADPHNYLKAVIDTDKRQLVVTGKLDGKAVDPITKSLARRIPHRHLYDKGSTYLDVAAWIYALRSPSVVSGVDIRWLEGPNPHLQQEFFVPSEDLLIRYATLSRDAVRAVDTGFYDTDQRKHVVQRPGVLNHIRTRPFTGNHVGFGFYEFAASLVPGPSTKRLVTGTPGTPAGLGEVIGHDIEEPVGVASRPQEALVCVEVESSYFFRCVKLKDKVIIELNGQPMLEIAGSWPASQVGLLTEGQACSFDGITLMHLPTEPSK